MQKKTITPWTIFIFSAAVLVSTAFSLSTFAHGQAYQGTLQKDSVTNKYIYYRHSSDHFIFSGKPTLIHKDKIRLKKNQDGDTSFVWLYEVTVDSVLFGYDEDAQNCNTVYILAGNYNRRIIEQSKIFLTNRPYYATSKPSVAYSSNYRPGRGLEYYNLNGGLNISVDNITAIKEKLLIGSRTPMSSLTVEEQMERYISIPPLYKKVKYRNKNEKIIIKRRKKSGCKISSKPVRYLNR